MKELASVFCRPFLFFLFVPFFFLGSCTVISEQETPVVMVSDAKSVDGRLDVLEREIIRLEKYQNRTDVLVEKSFNSTNVVLVTLTAVIAIVAIFLTWYISHAERKIKGIEKTVSEKEASITQLVNMINNNIDSLFERVRRSDTVFLLNRLQIIPQDIVNLENSLLARDLLPEDFSKLKSAYAKLCSQKLETEISALGNRSFGDLYMFVFFQHFLGESVMDDTLRSPIIDSLLTALDGAFKNDVERAARSISEVLSNRNSNIDRAEVLYCFRRSLNLSRFSEDENILDLMRKDINDNNLWEQVNDRLNNEE